MGGFAAKVSWTGGVDSGDVFTSLDTVRHRCRSGVRVEAFGANVVLGEGYVDTAHAAERTNGIARLGTLAIVGDVRLWDRSRAEAEIDDLEGLGEMSDRQLILQLYASRGESGLALLDGDYGFVIWDGERTCAVAVRDRAGVKPVFYRCTSDGIEFASEPKQLVARRGTAPTPCDRAIFGFLRQQPVDSSLTFFEGVFRLPSARMMSASADEVVERDYVLSSMSNLQKTQSGDVGTAFRRAMVESVERRVNGRGHVACKMSGGLDSSSVVAAAADVARRSTSFSFSTLSATFPGHSCDETYWIRLNAEQFGFASCEYVPGLTTAHDLIEEMWQIDSPLVDLQGAIFTDAVHLALDRDVQMLLTGLGGDEVTDEWHIVTDLLTRRNVLRWWRVTGAAAQYWFGSSLGFRLAAARPVVPRLLKSIRRRFRPRRSTPERTLVSSELMQIMESIDETAAESDYGLGSRLQNMVMVYSSGPATWALVESFEAKCAFAGLEASHPFLDRTVVECAASVSPDNHPFDGRAKALIREGFGDALPIEVLNRRAKTVFDDFRQVSMESLAPMYRRRFQTVIPVAERYLDAHAYRERLADTSSPNSDDLFAAWLLMEWLESLERYVDSRI